MVEEGVAEVHVVETVGGGFFDDGAGFGVVDAGGGDIDVGVGDVLVAGEERGNFGPVEEVRGVGDAELSCDVVEGGVGNVESTVDSDYTWILSPTDGLVVFGGVDDGLVEACEVNAVGRPG